MAAYRTQMKTALDGLDASNDIQADWKPAVKEILATNVAYMDDCLAKGVVTLSATSPDAGSATEEIEVEYKAAPLEIGFNSRYLLDITEQIVGSEARFLMADAGSPTLVRDGADESALYVLMPMRV